jgi:hypothetical protein
VKKPLGETVVAATIPAEIYETLEVIVGKAWAEALEKFETKRGNGSTLMSVLSVRSWLRDVEDHFQRPFLTPLSIEVPISGGIYGELEHLVRRAWDKALEQFENNHGDGSTLMQFIPVRSWLRHVEDKLFE